ncbi:tetratricopeptide repeat protein [Citrobacter amalonaticus]|uniref:tetratricopeptide repeat protein n=1 Tax=Citrobacter amalonaticus TaxID=35703 RepID=UPI00300D8687
MMGNLPQVYPTHQQETDSFKKIESIIPSEKFILRKESGGDYGVDCILEIIENGFATNIRSHVQLKSKKNQFLNSDGYFKYSVPIKTINYLSNTLSSIFIIYSESEDVVYWEWNSVILEKINQSTKTGTKSFKYSFYKTFDSKNIDEIYLTIKNKNEIIINLGLNSLEKGVLENLITEDISYDLLLNFFKKNDYDSIVGKLKNKKEPTLGEISLLSLSYYYMYQYDKALMTILKFESKGFKNNHLLKIKACIFCEKGIKEKNLNLVKDAKKMHDEALNGVCWDWLDHYNYANMDLALGNFRDAINEYNNSLKINPKDARAWKNLAQCYYEVGKNKKAFSCLDQALSINPELIEAILTKARMLRDVKKAPLDALELYDQAMNIATQTGFDMSSIFYQKSLSFFQADKTLDAISTIQDGLIYFPGDFYLTGLKLSILARSWSTDTTLAEITIQSFTQQLEEHPDDIEAKKVLAEIFLKNNDTKNFEKIVKSCLEQYGLPYSLDSILDHDIESIFMFIKYIDKSHIYRKNSNLCSELFSVYELNLSYANEIQFHFDILYSDLYSKIETKLSKKNFLNILDKHLLSGINISKSVSRILSKYQSVKIKNKEDIANNITYLISSIPEITLREISRQIGYAAGILGYDATLLDKNINTSNKISNWFTLSIEPILTGSNEVYKVFKE